MTQVPVIMRSTDLFFQNVYGLRLSCFYARDVQGLLLLNRHQHNISNVFKNNNLRIISGRSFNLRRKCASLVFFYSWSVFQMLMMHQLGISLYFLAELPFCRDIKSHEKIPNPRKNPQDIQKSKNLRGLSPNLGD